MTASPDRLPPALSSMWRLLKLGYRHEPRLLSAVVRAVAAGRAARRAARALAQAAGRGRARGRPPPARRRRPRPRRCRPPPPGSCVTVSTRVQRRFRDKVTIALESHVARLQASVATIAHQERPEYLDRLSVLRNQVFVLDHMYMSLFSTCGWILRLAVVIVALLMSIHPALALLAVFALPTVLHLDLAAGRRARGRGARARRPTGWPGTCSTTATTAPPGKEVRVTGIGARLVARAARRPGSAGTGRWPPRAGRAPSGTRWPGRSSAAPTSARSCSCRRACARRRATCCWCSRPARGSRPTSARRWARSASCAASGSTARGAWPGSRTTRRRWWQRADQPAPARLARGHPPRGRVVRLSRHRAPRARRRRPRRCPRARWSRSSARTAPARRRSSSCCASSTSRRAGRILVDGAPLGAHARRTSGARAWPAPSRTSSASSCRARHSVGVGDVPRLDDEPAVVGGGRPRRRRRRGGAAARRPRHAARADLARRRRGLVRPVAEARAGPRLHARASRCCWCSTSPRRRSTPRPSTRCSSATRRRRAATAPGRRSGRHHDPGVAPLQHRAHGRPHRRARRRARGRGRHARGADGEGRPVRRALRHPGRGLPLRLRRRGRPARP